MTKNLTIKYNNEPQEDDYGALYYFLQVLAHTLKLLFLV